MLNVLNLTIHYGEIKALEKVSISVKKGEIVALLGANGAGKSTLLGALSGLVAHKEGQIDFNGENIGNKPTEQIVKKGLIQVPEGRELFQQLTVKENLMMGAYLVKNKNIIKNSLDMTNELFPILEKKGRDIAGTLSGGEQQMLSIGRALMSNPKLIMLDEPSLGIAPILVQRIFNVIKKLSESGLTILLVEQNVFLALKISNRGYVLERGKIVLEDLSKNLLKNPEVEKSYLGI